MRRGTVVRIWREFNEKPSWRYRELAPGLLLRSLNFVDADMNGSELNRAEWFWRRRPRLILGEGFFGWALVCITVVILFSLPGAFVWLGVDSFTSLGLALGWILGAYVAIVLDTARLAQWRREYELSVDRLIRGGTCGENRHHL
jgi:hypothetical protein